ncbi:MAG: WD40 repeat domain-containing protein [Promethearchaeota archaeon]
MIRKRYQSNWTFECPDAVLTCSIMKCKENFLAFGGHDKILYLMDEKMNIIDDREFDGWIRCSYPIDLDGDGCDEILVGAGDGNFMVLKLNVEKKKLAGLMRYKSANKVNCCVAGDLTRDGNIELIIGSEDKTIKIFDSIKAKEPKFIFYFDSWVTACTLGFLQLPNEKEPLYGLIVGTKNGLLQLIQIKNNFPEIVWNKYFSSQVNTIKIGDVTNDGLNEILLGTDDSTIKILNSEGELVKEINSEEGRPISLLIEDIDGDKAKEIVAGCADGSLKVYHNPELDSKDIELKWKTKVPTSIKDVCYLIGDEPDKKHIIFGGYDRTIRNVTDFEWGQKNILNIPQKIKVPEISESKKELAIEDFSKIQEVPTNIRKHIFKILNDKGYTKELVEELTDLGYSQEDISNELEIMTTQKSILYEKVVYPVWSLPSEEIGEKKEVEVPVEEEKVSVKHMVIEEPIKTDKEKLRVALSSEVKPSEKKVAVEKVTSPEKVEITEKVSTGASLTNVIIQHLKDKELIATKPQFVNDIITKGFPKSSVEKEIDSLKEQGIIAYSRAKPKGWSLTN